MKNVSIIDESFDINSSSTYHLSIEASPFGISYTILDTVRVKYIALKHIQFDHPVQKEDLKLKLKAVLNTEGYLKKNYKSTSFSFISNKSLLIPSPLFEKKQLKTYFLFNLELEEDDLLMYNHVKAMDAYNVFSMPAAIQNMFQTRFKNILMLNQTSSFIDLIFAHNRNKSANQEVYACIHNDFFEIAVKNNSNLQFHNSFKYKDHKDIIYFILYIYTHLKIKPEEGKLYISGAIEKDSDLYQELKKYIKKVSYEEYNASFNYSYSFYTIPEHQFTNLVNQYNCE